MAVFQVAGATYKAMEFAGETLDAMNMDERMTICNMAVEAGGKNGVAAPDQTTFDYVDTRNPGNGYTPQYADASANYLKEFTIDVSKLEPLVAAPHSPENRKTARACSGVPIDRVYIGSCTGPFCIVSTR
jgi:3-isopropylmalate/(R)-2-methylmalate dehydratase large subunit